MKSDFAGLLPPYYASHPLTDVACDLFVALQIYANELRSLRSANSTTQTKLEEVKRAEPTSSAAAPAATQNGVGKNGWAKSFSDDRQEFI